MENFVQSQKDQVEKVELMNRKRQQKTLREFKEVLQNLVFLFREATQADTSYLYWINRSRRQFVLEARSTLVEEIRFQDRVGFDDHFLDRYKAIDEPINLIVGQDIDQQSMTHYYGKLSLEHVMLVPFINNDETVAITVLEWGGKPISFSKNEVIHSYSNALGNVLNTYLEISDMYRDQQEWVEYEESLSFLNISGHSAALLSEMLQMLQSFLSNGSVSLIANGMGIWTNVLNSSCAEPFPIGMPVEKRTVAWETLKRRASYFAIHFNNNPKRISPRENYTEGASLAIPIAFNSQSRGLILVCEENPLVFKESTKHKLINIVRLTALKIQTRLNKKENQECLLTNQFGAFVPDIWERIIDREIECLKNGGASYNTWMGFATLSNLAEIRTQFRIEELNCMQRDTIKALNPSQFGIMGIVGSHTDYVYMVFMQSKDPDALKQWRSKVNEMFGAPFVLSNGKQIESSIISGFTLLNARNEDAYGVVRQSKAKLSENTKSKSSDR